MKKLLTRALALAGLLALSFGVPGCSSSGYDEPYSGYGYATGGVAVYGTGYYAPGWGGCCYGPTGGVAVVVPRGYY